MNGDWRVGEVEFRGEEAKDLNGHSSCVRCVGGGKWRRVEVGDNTSAGGAADGEASAI